MVQVREGVACPVMVGLLMENSGQCSILKVLGSIQMLISSRQLDMKLVNRKETLEVGIG